MVLSLQSPLSFRVSLARGKFMSVTNRVYSRFPLMLFVWCVLCCFLIWESVYWTLPLPMPSRFGVSLSL